MSDHSKIRHKIKISTYSRKTRVEQDTDSDWGYEKSIGVSYAKDRALDRKRHWAEFKLLGTSQGANRCHKHVWGQINRKQIYKVQN